MAGPGVDDSEAADAGVRLTAGRGADAVERAARLAAAAGAPTGAGGGMTEAHRLPDASVVSSLMWL